MMAVKALITPLDYRIDFRKIPLNETTDDLGKDKYNVYHTSNSSLLSTNYFLISRTKNKKN